MSEKVEVFSKTKSGPGWKLGKERRPLARPFQFEIVKGKRGIATVQHVVDEASFRLGEMERLEKRWSRMRSQAGGNREITPTPKIRELGFADDLVRRREE